jgi:hypothetical protein
VLAVEVTTNDQRPPHVDCPPCPAGHHCGTPIRECHRKDVAQWEADRNAANLWCPCCGAFWRASEDDVLKAEMALVAWDEMKHTPSERAKNP